MRVITRYDARLRADVADDALRRHILRSMPPSAEAEVLSSRHAHMLRRRYAAAAVLQVHCRHRHAARGMPKYFRPHASVRCHVFTVLLRVDKAAPFFFAARTIAASKCAAFFLSSDTRTVYARFSFSSECAMLPRAICHAQY